MEKFDLMSRLIALSKIVPININENKLRVEFSTEPNTKNVVDVNYRYLIEKRYDVLGRAIQTFFAGAEYKNIIFKDEKLIVRIVDENKRILAMCSIDDLSLAELQK